MKILDRLRSLVPSWTPKGPSAMGLLNSEPFNIPWLGLQRLPNPNLDTGTDGRGTWRELHEALIDPKASSCLDMRCQIVSNLPWALIPRPETPPEAVDLVRRALDGLNLVEDVEEMARAAYFGLVPLEVRWEVVKGALVPVDLASFEPIHLSFNPDRTPCVNGAPAEPGTLMLHRHGSCFRNPWGLGRGRTVPRWTRVKVAVAYATYRDYPRYAHDRILFRYPDGTLDEEQARYVQIASRLMDSPGLVVPDGMSAERLQLDSKFEVGTKLIDAADAQIATGILGNTLTTGEGQHGTQALGSVHENQSQRQEAADARRIEATLNRTLIPWIVALNLGPDVVPPLFRYEREVPAALKDRLDIAMGLKQEGLKISQIWARETFGIPEPQDEEDELVSEAPATAPGLPGVPQVEVKPPLIRLSSEDPMEGMFSRWMDGYVQRQCAVNRMAAQVVGDAQGFDHARESLLGLARDFPRSAAEWMASSLQAARDAGAWEVSREVAGLSLAGAEPELDFNLPPELALRWLQGKTPMTIKQADALKDADLRARAFWVAGLDQMDTLQALQRSLGEALAKGIPFDAWKGTWLAKLQGTGIGEGRLRTAFDLQLHTAYMGGRMASLMANPAVVNLTFVTAGDEAVRPEHRVFDGVTLPKTHLFWATHTPPLGFNCRCRIRAAASDEAVTSSQDPRLQTPPDTGFGQGAQSFNTYLDRMARQPGADFQPIPAQHPGWRWLESTRPSAGLVPSSDGGSGSSSGLLTDPTGREVFVREGLDGTPVVAPGEAWLAPVLGPEGQLGLQISYLRGGPCQEAEVLTVLDGLARQRLFTDPTPFRQGVKLL